jgi:SAM-dependent methyltransferase
MQQREQEALIRLYEDRYREMGRDVRTLGWKSIDDQVLRFEVLCDVGDMKDCEVADVGCGFADLYDYLQRRFGQTRYFGVDISPSLIEDIRRVRPTLDVQQADILAPAYARTADYFVLSGALSYKLEDNLAFTKQMLTKMFGLCRRGVAANFLSSYVNYQHERNYYHRPEDVLSIAKQITPWVALRHDYPLWEFTIYLYREAQRSLPRLRPLA